VSKHTARVIRVGLAVLERLPVCPDNQTYSELVQTALSGQDQTRAAQQRHEVWIMRIIPPG